MSTVPEKEIQNIAELFVNGHPVDDDVPIIDEDVVFHFDNPFQEDISEPYVVASLLISNDQFPDFDPSDTELNSVPELDRADGIIQRGLQRGGMNVTSPEFDRQNSDENLLVYQYRITF